MATLVLTAVGTIVGGPIGGAIGAALGQAADQALFAPEPREGPRLGDLAVQTSSYGSSIPKIFGKMRVAGTVIWSTDIREERSTSSAAKGQPKTASYSYSASFAVALSGRPVRAVRRIWADGKLLRGGAGDLKSRAVFRLYSGTEDQPVDPLIASVEGSGQAPAFRGIAYVLFEDLALEDFGNRIPSLTFEVEAEAEPVSIGAIAAELSAGILLAGVTRNLSGYAASGQSMRNAIEAMAAVLPLSLVESEDGICVETGPSTAASIEDADRVGRLESTRLGAGKLPRDLTLTYYDAARDYQLGLQRAFRSNSGQRSERRELPAVLSAQAAKSLAEERLAQLWAGSARGKIELPWRMAHLRPGVHVRLPNSPDIWRVERWTLGPLNVALELVRVPSETSASLVEATPGRQVEQPDLLHGPTLLRLLDLPLGDEARTRPLLLAAAAGPDAGWRRAQLMTSFDDGSSWAAAGPTGARAVMGSAVTVLAQGDSALFYDQEAVEIELLNESMWIESRTDEALSAGANLALLGGELIQFGRAELIAAGRYRLSRLLRGRRGTEWAAASHAPGEAFTLIEEAAVAAIDAPAGIVGAEMRVIAEGIGDLQPAEAKVRVSGAALQPPSPVHLKADPDGAGGLRISWVRRSRLGWTWESGRDVPLAEESESYRLTVAGRTATLLGTTYHYPAEQRSADAAAGPVEVEVVQVGTFATSRPARLVLG